MVAVVLVMEVSPLLLMLRGMRSSSVEVARKAKKAHLLPVSDGARFSKADLVSSSATTIEVVDVATTW